MSDKMIKNQEKIELTERLALEPLKKYHAKYFFKPLQNSQIYKFIPTKKPISVQDLAQRYAVLETRLSPDKTQIWLNWAIRLKNTETKFIGRLEATVYPDKSADIAYILFPEFWGKGYANEACLALINMLQNDYFSTKISANVDTLNIASISLLEKLNFEKIDTLFNVDFFNNRQSDEFVFCLK